MSYDIYLTDSVTREPIELEEAHYMRGGTYVLSGTTEAWLNITYNYADWYYRPGVFGETADNKGIRTIYGLSGADQHHLPGGGSHQKQGDGGIYP